MRSRTRPGPVVPASMEPVPALDDVIEGRDLYAGATASAREALPLASPPAPTMAARMGDSETREAARERHIAVLQAQLDATVAQVRELGRQLGLPDWKPEPPA